MRTYSLEMDEICTVLSEYVVKKHLPDGQYACGAALQTTGPVVRFFILIAEPGESEEDVEKLRAKLFPQNAIHMKDVT